MARFILDVATTNVGTNNDFEMTNEQIKKINIAVCNVLNNDNFCSGVITIHCIDATNENQFYDGEFKSDTNKLNSKQIANFKNVCDTWK